MTQPKTDARWQQRLQNLEKAFADFDAACGLERYTKLERSGLIQTFEIVFELAWKLLQDLLQERGYTDALGPRPVLKRAFRDGLISNGEAWLKMLAARNLTAHSHDEATADAIARESREHFHPLLLTLLTALRHEAAKPE
jgi:nucleotidyltransferase substrate binding protein (TIGR01987 family)